MAPGVARGGLIVRVQSCLACGGTLRDLGVRKGYTYAACDACGSVQLRDPPSDDELARMYRDEYHRMQHYASDPEKSRLERWRVCRQVTHVIERESRGDGPVLEVGAGWGSLGLAVREAGLSYVGFEPSDVMSTQARAAGLDVRTGTLEANGPPPQPIRAVVLMAVYEHIPRQRETLVRLRELLRGDAPLIIQCPTAGFPRVVGRLARALGFHELPSVFGSLAPPWHVCLPSPGGLRAQAEAAGLRVDAVLASRSGRSRDWRAVLQSLNEVIGAAGHAVSDAWPFTMAHIFVLRRSTG